MELTCYVYNNSRTRHYPGPVSSNALFEYIVSANCPLERLILNAADVDDYECQRFVDAIQQNKSLRELDLSNNKVGMAENLNTVMPNIVTGNYYSCIYMHFVLWQLLLHCFKPILFITP
ncbi:hypothetical protein EON65_33630 [archaeon]|nr:MAG: hypothetical protein EON65_33630 [archaeon]